MSNLVAEESLVIADKPKKTNFMVLRTRGHSPNFVMTRLDRFPGEIPTAWDVMRFFRLVLKNERDGENSELKTKLSDCLNQTLTRKPYKDTYSATTRKIHCQMSRYNIPWP